MKSRRYDLAHIDAIVREVEGGETVERVTRRHNISPATFFRWRKLVRAETAPSIADVSALREENHELRATVERQTREIEALRCVIAGKR